MSRVHDLSYTIIFAPQNTFFLENTTYNSPALKVERCINMNFKATKTAVFDEEKTVLMTSHILAGEKQSCICLHQCYSCTQCSCVFYK